MSENLDLVRSIYAAWESGDYRSSVKLSHPEIELELVEGPEPGRWVGRDAAIRRFQDWLAVLEDLRVCADAYRELDHERVLVFTHISGHGKTSGLDLGNIRAEGAALLHVRDGKITKIVQYVSRDRALADLGLVE